MRDPDDQRPTGDNVDGAGTAGNSHLVSGTNVGGYVIDGELGSGGMGVVYSATHPLIGKRAAVKVLRPELSDNPAAVERFMMEARAVNQIGHPNIVDIFAFGNLPDGRSYYVMDLLNGESLRRRVKRGGPLHVSEAASVIDELSSALIAAHDKGVIHRDLKPDNVFMVSVPGRWPEVRILDWGLLKLSSTASSVGNSSKYRTLAGSVMGTPVYMSPEQARASDSVDFRTDIYSLGVMAYEILSGTVPFKKGSSIDTLLAHQDEPVPPLAQKCPALPEELVQLIEAMLSKEAEGRPTLTAVRAVIKRLKGSKIPTMTAAGLSMPPGPSAPFVEPPTNRTIDDRNRERDGAASNPSMELTVPRTSSRDSLPLPAPPQTPMSGEAAGISLPYATLAGHSMPSAGSAPFRAAGKSAPIGSQLPHTPVPSAPPSYSPSHSQLPHALPPTPATLYGAQGYSQPMPQMQQPQSSGPALQQAPAAPSNVGRIVVILIVAVIASAIGITLLLSN